MKDNFFSLCILAYRDSQKEEEFTVENETVEKIAKLLRISKVPQHLQCAFLLVGILASRDSQKEQEFTIENETMELTFENFESPATFAMRIAARRGFQKSVV